VNGSSANCGSEACSALPGRVGAKARVFLMTDSLETGGSERQFVALARSLEGGVFTTELGCLQRKGAFRDAAGEIAEFPTGGSFCSWRAQVSRLQLARHLMAKGTSVVHSFDFYSNLMLIPSAKWSRIPVVIGSQRQLGDRLTRLQSAAQIGAFHLCDRIVCNSCAAGQRLIQSGLSEGKVVVIPNGLPAEAFERLQPVLRRQPGRVRISYVARMNDPAKNHRGFLRTAARLASRFPSIEIVLVGDGPLRSGLEEPSRQLGLGDRIRFLGERRDMAAILASVDISVLFSFSESMPNVILEAMAAGVPVVASRVGGAPEVIRDRETGILVKSGDEEELARAIGTLVEQPSLRLEYGRRGRQLAQDNFRMERVSRRYEELYTSVLEEKTVSARRARMFPGPSPLRPRQIRVALVAASPRWVGGQGVQADLLVRHWRDDPAVAIHFIPIDPALPGWLRWVERIPWLRTCARMPFYGAALWRGIRNADIVHIFSAAYWSFLLVVVPAWLLAQLHGAKSLIHYHSGEAPDHLSRSRIARRILRGADCVIVPSEYLAAGFREFGLETRIVPNLVDWRQFSFRLREPLRPRLICPRGFHPYYGVDTVVRAFRVIRGQYPGARLCLVGKGATERRTRDLVAELGINGVEFVGAVPHKEIGSYYDENDIFINASWLDNSPVSILEAFASGTPVVTTAPEGIRYLVEHERTGLLCEPADWGALGENVLRLLREPTLAVRLSRNARAESQRYCWEQVRPKWLEAYRSLCAMECLSERQRTHTPRLRQGFTVFFTGLSGSGKSTIANELSAQMMERECRPVTLLDGDAVRKLLSSELGFSREHRDMNILRIGFVASEITKHGGITICAVIAPFDAVRRQVRSAVQSHGGFVLVYLSTPLETCEQRDPKGLYAKARAGLIQNFTGISDEYEIPEDADLTIDTREGTPETAAQEILMYLERRGFLRARPWGNPREMNAKNQPLEAVAR
jgi:adenylyl-sulfate kinase